MRVQYHILIDATLTEILQFDERRSQPPMLFFLASFSLIFFLYRPEMHHHLSPSASILSTHFLTLCPPCSHLILCSQAFGLMLWPINAVQVPPGLSTSTTANSSGQEDLILTRHRCCCKPNWKMHKSRKCRTAPWRQGSEEDVCHNQMS